MVETHLYPKWIKKCVQVGWEVYGLVKMCCRKTGRDENWACMGKVLSNECLRGRGSSWRSLKTEGSCDWKCSVRAPKQLLQWLALFKRRGQKHPPTSWNDDSTISGVRRHKSQGQWFQLRGVIHLSLQGDLACVHASFKNKPDQVSHHCDFESLACL